MLTIHFTSGETPQEIFKKLAQAESEYEHARNYKPVPIPEYQKPERVKRGIAGWYIFAVETLKELKP